MTLSQATASGEAPGGSSVSALPAYIVRYADGTEDRLGAGAAQFTVTVRDRAHRTVHDLLEPGGLFLNRRGPRAHLTRDDMCARGTA